MGLAKKGTNKITVDGVAYRWVVSPDSGYMWVIVELSQESGQRLEAGAFPYDDRPADCDAIAGDQIAHRQNEITPHAVKKIIELALSKGWRPTLKGLPPFQLRDTEKRIALPHRGESHGNNCK